MFLLGKIKFLFLQKNLNLKHIFNLFLVGRYHFAMVKHTVQRAWFLHLELMEDLVFILSHQAHFSLDEIK